MSVENKFRSLESIIGSIWNELYVEAKFECEWDANKIADCLLQMLRLVVHKKKFCK